jgi:CO/xanthine dehydrogenase FAD-binding subunit
VITEYHRPKSIDEALKLLSRPSPLTLPLGGGTVLNLSSPPDCAVVDIQDLGLTNLEEKSDMLIVGAMVTLQSLAGYAGQQATDTGAVLKRVIEYESTYNTRQCATLGGLVASAGGRSPLGTVLLALDCQLTLVPGNQRLLFGELLPLRQENLKGKLITEVGIPLKAGLAFEYVARSPADRPIVCTAVAVWPSGRTRIALGGYGKAPLLAMDGPNAEGGVEAARDAYSSAQDDWGSGEYRREVAGILTRRCLDSLSGNQAEAQ